MLSIWLVEISVNKQEATQIPYPQSEENEKLFDISLMPYIHHIKINLPVVFTQVGKTLCIVGSKFLFRDIDRKTEEEKRKQEGGGRKSYPVDPCAEAEVMVGGKEGFE